MSGPSVSSHINKRLPCQQSKQVSLTTEACNRWDTHTYARSSDILCPRALLLMSSSLVYPVLPPPPPRPSAHLSPHHSARWEPSVGQFISLLSWHFHSGPALLHFRHSADAAVRSRRAGKRARRWGNQCGLTGSVAVAGFEPVTFYCFLYSFFGPGPENLLQQHRYLSCVPDSYYLLIHERI